MKVLHIWYADYPWDVRVEKVVAALHDAGMTVCLLARNLGNLKPYESTGEAEIYRLRWIRSKVKEHWINSISTFPAFVNPRWILHILRVCRSKRPDLILVRDLPLAPAAIWVGKLQRIPVVMDMAENYPAFLRSLRQTGTLGVLDMLIRNPNLAAVVERYVLRHIDATVCVIEESAERLVRSGVATSKIFVVRNTPRLEALPRREASYDAHDTLTIAYLGLIERHRGVQDLVRAVSASRRNGKPLRILVIGDGKGLKELRALASELGVLEHGVELLGRVENREALEILSSADVGAIPHMPGDAWDTTIPNKLFDYMSLGLPVLTSNVRPVQRIVAEASCGLSYEWGNTRDISAKIDILRSPSVRRSMGEAGRAAVCSTFNWSRDGAVLAQSLQSVCERYRAPPKSARQR